MATPQTDAIVADIRPLIGRMRAAALASIAAIFAIGSLAEDGAGYLIAIPFVVPYLLILLLARRKEGLAWARVTGWVALVVSVWFVIIALQPFGEARTRWITFVSFAVLVVAQVIQLRAAGQARQILRNEGKLTGSVVPASIFPALYVAFFVLLAAISIPSLLRSRTAANEASAVGSLRTINTAVRTYSGEHKAAPPDLQSMRGLLDDTLACAAPPCLKSGYRFTYTLTDAAAGHYNVIARPNKFNNTGWRSFYTDQSGEICFTTEDRAPTGKDSPLQ